MNVVELQTPRLVWSCSVKEAASGLYLVFYGSFIRLLGLLHWVAWPGDAGSSGAASMAPDEKAAL